MRVCEMNMIKALCNREGRKCGGNTSVVWVEYDGKPAAMVELYGHCIAIFVPHTGKMALSDAGWRTATTKSRLNALLRTFGNGERISQSKWVWYVGDKKWVGGHVLEGILR